MPQDEDHMSEEAVYSGLPQEEDRVVEPSLRPENFAGFVGQGDVVENLKTWIGGARQRDETLDHVLLSGPPGLGKTTLAYILANEMDSSIRSTSGPALAKPRDLVGILTNLQRGDMLFIDEVHRMDARVEEYLYTAMEDYEISIIIDPGPHSRSVTLPLKRFTLIGATTREGLLSAPLRSRFQIAERLDYYPAEELKRIILASASRLELQVEEDAAMQMAACARGTPRVANRYLRRIRDVAHARGQDVITREVAEEGLDMLGVDENGLCEMDRRILRAVAQNGGRPIGLKTLSVVVGEQEDTIEEVYEPYLIRRGFLEKTPRGRLLTPRGLDYLGLEPGEVPQEDGQKDLF
ncbi:MAG: Holliday junction branch migration DNA helicase RuvB [Planctomycetota bacterium]